MQLRKTLTDHKDNAITICLQKSAVHVTNFDPPPKYQTPQISVMVLQAGKML